MIDLRARLIPILAVLGLACACANPPSDEALLRRFEAHRGQLEELLAEIVSNPRMTTIERSLDGFSGPAVTREEVEEYRSKLRRVGVHSVKNWQHFNSDLPIQFIVYDYVIYHDGVQKGFAWSRREPDPVVPSLDGRRRHEGDGFRRIEDGWYLFFSPK